MTRRLAVLHAETIPGDPGALWVIPGERPDTGDPFGDSLLCSSDLARGIVLRAEDLVSVEVRD